MFIVTKITGNSLLATEFNQLPDEIENVISDTGQTPTAGDLNQLGKGIAIYTAYGDFYNVSGTANAITLGVSGSNQGIIQHITGGRIRFVPTLANTLAVTITITTIGGAPTALVTNNGTALVANDLIIGREVEAYYTGTEYRLVNPFGDANSQGEVALSDSISSSLDVDGRTAATPLAVKNASDTRVASSNIVSITASGNYVKPSNLLFIKSTLVGGGAGGGGGSTVFDSASGGAAGGTAFDIILASSLSASEAVVIGAGSAGSTGSASAGGNSTFFGRTANGGPGGRSMASNGYTVVGGTATGGDVNIQGGSPGLGTSTTGAFNNSGGVGGSSTFGGGGSGGNDLDGTNGGAPGAGGGGGGNGSSATSRTGGNGANGILIIEEFLS